MAFWVFQTFRLYSDDEAMRQASRYHFCVIMKRPHRLKARLVKDQTIRLQQKWLVAVIGAFQKPSIL